MIYVVILISTLLFAIAFIVTEKNAKHLLAGYNAMSAEEQQLVDVKSLIYYFKRFFILLAVSLLIISVLLIDNFNRNTVTIFICVYPVITVICFNIYCNKFYKKPVKK